MVIDYGSIVDVPGVRVGHADDRSAETGCTVVLFDAFDDSGAVCGVDVRGSAPGTRETDALGPTATVQRVHAVVLCGAARSVSMRPPASQARSKRPASASRSVPGGCRSCRPR
jgi:L-aminopeptidase/D-esterase-like protein